LQPIIRLRCLPETSPILNDRTTRIRSAAIGALTDVLEHRRLLSAVVDGQTFGIRGTPGNDVITVELNGTTATVTDNGVESTLEVARGKQMRIFLDGGNDALTVTLVGRSIPATVYGGAGNDTIDFLALDETVRLYGEAGDDYLSLFRSTPTSPQSLRTFSYGGAGNDRIDTTPGRNRIYGDEGNDTLLGNGTSTISGGSGNDTIYGEEGDDSIQGDDGDDSLIGGPGADTIDGWDGDDIIQGDQVNRPIDGRSRQDVINGGDGNDTINGNDQADQITGGAGADFFSLNEVDAAEVTDFTPGEDDNSARIAVSGRTLTISGSRVAEQFQVQFRRLEDKIVVRYQNPTETLRVSDPYDFPIDAVDSIRVFAMAGDDDIDVFVLPESVSTTIYGGGGDDVVATEAIAGTLRFYGEAGDDSAGVYDGDPIFGRRFLYGGSGNDFLHGGPRADILFGDAGNDTLIGGGGRDQLVGGNGTDQLFGNRGNDNLSGGDGVDSITGGSGADSFAQFERLAGEVLDFTAGVDVSS